MGLKRYALPDEVWVLVARRRHPRAHPYLMGVFSGRDAAFLRLMEELGPEQYDAFPLVTVDGDSFDGAARVRRYSPARGACYGHSRSMYYRLQRETVDDHLEAYRRLTVPRDGPFVPAWAARTVPYRAVIAWCAERRAAERAS